MSDIGTARRARDKLKESVGSEPFCAGVGVEREDGVGFVVRVRVQKGALAEAKHRIPERLDGVLVVIVENDA